jgi:phospholipid transport system transporter-binding protein
VCRLDLGGVTYSSSVGIALVLEWLRAAAEAGKSLHIDNMPADMTALVRVGGLDFLLSPSA